MLCLQASIAVVSVFTPTAADRKRRQELTLQLANSTSITTYGSRSLTLDLGLRCTFRWIFVIADVAMPIIGADFLRNFGLIVDMDRHRLSDSSTNSEVKGCTVDQPALCLTLLPLSQNSFQAILNEFPAVLQTSP